ncbi:sulfurtransferase complex subunit TusB [Marinobacter sp. X15-166B]|uniref:sulfurtransferase complex subunit TusB n=1 Tax=Marinobacter sp. X15-166B TaxID=1897620 RepID=UPI0009F62158|nr:sulfurtransferase complex subunit TusB [Marinobacter sp. X15-166B]
MTTLHILNKSPDHPRFALCLAAVTGEDQLLLTENAVLALADTTLTLPARVAALAADMDARGLTGNGLSRYGVGFDHMVRLTTQASRIISW